MSILKGHSDVRGGQEWDVDVIGDGSVRMKKEGCIGNVGLLCQGSFVGAFSTDSLFAGQISCRSGLWSAWVKSTQWRSYLISQFICIRSVSLSGSIIAFIRTDCLLTKIILNEVTLLVIWKFYIQLDLGMHQYFGTRCLTWTRKKPISRSPRQTFKHKLLLLFSALPTKHKNWSNLFGLFPEKWIFLT